MYISRWDFGRDFGGKHSPNHQGIIGLVGLVHFNHIINNLLTIMDSYCKMDTSIFPFFRVSMLIPILKKADVPGPLC